MVAGVLVQFHVVEELRHVVEVVLTLPLLMEEQTVPGQHQTLSLAIQAHVGLTLIILMVHILLLLHTQVL
jgi:hypothetical protein